MLPGWYVGRIPNRSRTNRVIIESICFARHPKMDDDWVKNQADNWRDFIQSQYLKDEVFLFEVFPPDQE
jgi:hypothetical protein